MQHALFDTVDEVGAIAAEEGIDCHWAKGGTYVLARTPVQLDRARAEIEDARAWGFGPEDYRCLPATEARAVVGATDVLGATYTPHCAAIHPARLVRGLALAVERARGHDPRGHHGPLDRAGRRAHHERPPARAVRHPRHRGLHRRR